MSESETPMERFKRALTHTTRALTATEDVEVIFGANRVSASNNTARLPLPSRGLSPQDAAIARGQADSAALWIAHHDPRLHACTAPQNPVGNEIFQALEKVRVEALGANRLPGVGDNLSAALEEQVRHQDFAPVSDRADLPMADMIAALVREKLTNRPAPKAMQPLLDPWRAKLAEEMGDALKALKSDNLLADQKRFAMAAKKLIEALSLGDMSDQQDEPEESDEAEDGEDNADDNQDQNPDAEDGADQPDDPTADFGETQESLEELLGEDEDSIDADLDQMLAEEMAGATNLPDNSADPGGNYKIFTREFDETAPAEDLCEPEELARLRKQLDQQVKGLNPVVSRLANRLQRRLMAQQNRAWSFDLDEGVLDAARLARVIADPTQPLSFKQEKQLDFRDTVVTLLLDNSGSMRGRPISIAAICADILARTLERCAVKTEILGFTTRAWKGGQSRDRWVEQNRPANPGRLNDLRHIIYKSADTPWRRAQTNLGLMMKEGLLKENIDGEALIWAHDRLIGRPEQRRILMVISDGAPVDDTTSSNNGGFYLERHLRDVIERIETSSPVELLAIGIGHDVTRFYKRAVTIADAEQLGGVMVDKLAELFEQNAAPTLAPAKAFAGDRHHAR